MNPPQWLKWPESQKITCLAVCYGVGLALHLIPLTRPLMLSITPFAILFTGGYVLGGLVLRQQPRLAVFLVFTYVFTFAVEAAVSFLLTAIFLWLRIDAPSRLPEANLVIQYVFFAVILICTCCAGDPNVNIF